MKVHERLQKLTLVEIERLLLYFGLKTDLNKEFGRIGISPLCLDYFEFKNSMDDSAEQLLYLMDSNQVTDMLSVVLATFTVLGGNTQRVSVYRIGKSTVAGRDMFPIIGKKESDFQCLVSSAFNDEYFFSFDFVLEIIQNLCYKNGIEPASDEFDGLLAINQLA